MKTVDINIVYNGIIEKLRAANKIDVITALNNSSAGAATGSEGLVLTGSSLLSLRDTDPIVFDLIKEEVSKYIKYCRKNGLIIK
jgi:hypothetical protein